VLGGLLSLLAAAAFAFNSVASRRAVLTGTVAQGMAITVPLGVPMFALAAAAAGYLGAVTEFSGRSLLLLSLAGMLHFVWGRYCNYRATKAMGANLTGNLQQFDLVLSLALAIWLLGETLTPLKVVGIILVVIGASMRPGKPASPSSTELPADASAEPADAVLAAADPPKPAAFTPNYAEGYLFGVLTMTGYAVSPILIRTALENTNIGTSLAAGLVSYLAATVLISLFVFWPGHVRHVLAVDRETVKWFTASGVTVCISQMFRYMALSVAPVTVVQPIQRLASLFRILFSWILNREHEVFGGAIIVGALLSIVGALALSVSTEIVLSAVPLPDWLVALARWQWP
jgi:drug/metabolite transporter (DMT)-like permease